MTRKLGLALVGIFFFGSLAFAQRPDLPGSLVIDLGVNSWSEKPTDAELNTFQSKTVNIIYYYDLPLGDNGWTLTPGIGLGLERYAFDNNTTLTSVVNNQNERIVSVTNLSTLLPTANSYDKSKLGLNYLDIPLELRYYTRKNDYSRGFRVALGLKAGILYSSFTKIKYEDTATDNRLERDRQQLGVNRFRYGVNARIGFGGFSFFGYYELSDKFETPPPGAADTRTLTFGISLTGF
jgi:hypothetical protein